MDLPIVLQDPGSNQKILITDTNRGENIDAAEFLSAVKPYFWRHLGIEPQWAASKWSAVLSEIRDKGGVIVEARHYVEGHDPSKLGNIVGVCVGEPTGFPGEMVLMCNEAAFDAERLKPLMKSTVAKIAAEKPQPMYFGHAEVKRVWVRDAD